MDDETAEIELLEQNLNKTHQISLRMTTILSSFDTRLNKLEKAITPLYRSMQVLDRRSANIDKALNKIDEIVSNQEGIAAEEAMILRGPQSGQLTAYTEALGRLNASITFKGADNPADSKLFETGVKKLTQEYTKLVAAGSSSSIGGGMDFQSMPFPQDLLADLQPLVLFLRSLPLPVTHPNHPSSSVILTVFKEAQRGYADMRGNWNKKRMELYGKRVVDRAETIDSMVAGREFGNWVNNLILVGEAEYDLLLKLAPLTATNSLAGTFTIFLDPLILTFASTFSSLTNLIKKSLHKHNFLALSAYDALTVLQPRWDELLALRQSQREIKDLDEMKEGLHNLRGVVLRSFPEALTDIKVAAVPSRPGELGSGPPEFMLVAIRYLEQLPAVRDAVGSALLAMGDGNWRMGEGFQTKKAAKLGEGDESIIIEHFTFDVVNTILQSLTALSKTSPRPTIGSIFLLNNVAYLRNAILLSPSRNKNLNKLLPRQITDILNSNFRTAKATYFETNYMPLLSSLDDQPRAQDNLKLGGGKIGTKDKYTRFYDLLEEIKERHLLHRVLRSHSGGEQDELEEEREALVEEVVRLVVPSLQRFMTKNRDKDFSKNPSKYLQLTPDEVESQIRSFY